jgi:DNA-directed RNA polymerase specialized sigma24 family protein
MKTLDYEYMGELLKMAQAGNKNAFAELYAATFAGQYEYAFECLGSDDLAKIALRKIYARVLSEIQSLQTPQLFMAWLNRVSFQVCFDMKKTKDSCELGDCTMRIGKNQYSLRQVMNLPLTESQVLIQHYYQKLPITENGRNLNISNASVKRYLSTGRAHLKKLMQHA